MPTPRGSQRESPPCPPLSVRPRPRELHSPLRCPPNPLGSRECGDRACPGLPLARGRGSKGRSNPAPGFPRSPARALRAREPGPVAPRTATTQSPRLPCGLRAASQGKGNDGVSRAHKSGVGYREIMECSRERLDPEGSASLRATAASSPPEMGGSARGRGGEAPRRDWGGERGVRLPFSVSLGVARARWGRRPSFEPVCLAGTGRRKLLRAEVRAKLRAHERKAGFRPRPDSLVGSESSKGGTVTGSPGKGH